MSVNAETGRLGEDIAAEYLQENGFRILERGWRSGRLEVDIIAARGNTIHIVEVKCRRNGISGGDEFSPEFAMNAGKRERLLAALEDYAREKDFGGEFSLDLIAVNITPSGHELRFYEGVQW